MHGISSSSLSHDKGWERAHDDLNCLTCSATHIYTHMIHRSLEVVFSNSRSKNRTPIPRPYLRNRKCSVHRLRLIVSFLCARNCLGIFPFYPFPFSAPQLPHHVSQLKATENGLCGRWRAAIFYVYLNFRWMERKFDQTLVYFALI